MPHPIVIYSTFRIISMVERIFLSGRFDVGTAIEKAWLKRTGCKYRCFSYANIDKNNSSYNKRVIESLAVCEAQKIAIMMDSGAATLHNIQGSTSSRKATKLAKVDLDTTALAEQVFQSYVDYCKLNYRKWSFFVTLDFKKHQPTIFAMQKRFESQGLHPCPVFHGDASLDWVTKYHDRGCKLIGISPAGFFARRHSPHKFRFYLDAVFNHTAKLGMDIHGLAITSLSLMTQYPWWSVDSAAWTKTASFGAILFPNTSKNTIENVHISSKSSASAHSYGKMSVRHKQEIAERITELGFVLKELQDDVKARHDFNGFVFSNLTRIGLNIKNSEGAKWETLL